MEGNSYALVREIFMQAMTLALGYPYTTHFHAYVRTYGIPRSYHAVLDLDMQ